MKTNRSLLALILLSLITCGIYSLYFWHVYARDMNVVCMGDGKHTRGILARIVFSILTLGIYDLIWMYGAGERISLNCHRYQTHCNTSGGSVLLWYLLGSLIIVGPFIALYKLIDGLNQLSIAYNNNSVKSAGGVNVNVNVNA